MKRLFIFCNLIILCLVTITGTAYATFPIDWGRKCELVIDSTLVSSDLSDFPILLTVANLPSEMFDADGSYPALSGGGDIRFSSDEAGLTQLPCEIVSFTIDNDPANGTAEIWVKVPDVYSAVDTSFYVWYNKAGETQPAASDTYGSQAVWSDYVMVQHLNDNPNTSYVKDSTANQITGTKTGAANPTEATGAVGKGQSFNGTTSKITCADAGIYDSGSGDFSVSAFVTTDTTRQHNILAKDDVSTQRQFNFYLNSSNYPSLSYFSSGPTLYFGQYQTACSNSTTYYLCGQKVGTDIEIFVNGDKKTLTNSGTPATTVLSTTSDVLIGTDGRVSPYYADGTYDEIRYSLRSYSAAWVAAEYSSYSSPGTFISSQTPEVAGVSGVNLDLKCLITDSATGNLDLKIRLRNATTWYIRPSGTTYGSADGTSYSNAWAGWDNVVWGSIDDVDKIEDYSGETYSLSDVSFTDAVIITGHVAIDGTTTINNANWTNVSGNIYKTTINANSIDSYGASPPGSPSVGDVWFSTSKSSSSHYMVPFGRPLIWDGTDWILPLASEAWDRPNLVYKNGYRTYPCISDGGNIASFPTATSLTCAGFDGEVDDYWAGSLISMKNRVFHYETSIVTASSGSTVEFYELGTGWPYTSGMNVFIMANINELTTEGEWAWDGVDQLYIYSTSPSSHVWSYASTGMVISLNRCSGIVIKGYDISKCNDSPIGIFKSTNITIDGNVIDDCWASGFFYAGGAILAEGYSFVADANTNSTTENSTGLTISNNQISNIYNANGIDVYRYDVLAITGNSVTNIGDETYPTHIDMGIQINFSNYPTVSNNYAAYQLYSGIFMLGTKYGDVHDNVVAHGLNFYSDGGVLYIAGLNGTMGSSSVSQYNHVYSNRIEWVSTEQATTGLYVDVGSSNNICEENIFYAIHGLGNDTDTNNYAAAFENQSSGCLNNTFLNNEIYDNKCLVYNNYKSSPSPYYFVGWSGSPSPGTSTWPTGVPDAYGNVRYDESTYAFISTDLLDLKASPGNWPTNYIDLKAIIKGSSFDNLDLLVILSGSVGISIGGISGATGIGGIH